MRVRVKAAVIAKAVCVYTKPVCFKTFNIHDNRVQCFQETFPNKIKQKVLKSGRNNLSYAGFYTRLCMPVRAGKRFAAQLAKTGAEAAEVNGLMNDVQPKKLYRYLGNVIITNKSDSLITVYCTALLL